MIFHVILRRRYEDVSGFVVDYATRASSVVCCEHVPDSAEKTVHCHVVIDTENCAEAIRKRINVFKLGGRGQYAIMTKTASERLPYGRRELLKYVLKGLNRQQPQESFLKYSLGVSQNEIDAAVQEWDVRKPETVATDDKKGKTHYALIKEIYAEAKKDVRIVRDEFGNLINEECVENSLATWHLMCRKLNENEVRTSSHELERFYVTLLRQDPLHQETLYTKLMKKLG